jgi:hypothetical protein
MPYLVAFQLFLICSAIYLTRKDSDLPGAAPRIPLAFLPALCLVMVTGAWLHTGLVLYFDRLTDMKAAYSHRAAGVFNKVFLEQAWSWITYLYPKPLIVMALLWLVSLPVRIAAGKARARHLLPGLFGFTQIVYVILFPTAVAIHIYRYYTFSILVAFVFCDLATLIAEGARRVVPRLLAGKPALVARVRTWAPVAAVGLLLVPLWSHELKRGVSVLRESRRLSGAVLFQGYNPQRHESEFFAQVNKATTPLHEVLFHSSIPQPRWEGFWQLDRDWRAVASVPGRGQSSPRPTVLLVVEGGRGLSTEAFHELVRTHPMTRWGRYWMVDLMKTGAHLEAYDFEDKKPSRLYKFFGSEFYPPLKPVRNPGDEWRILLAAAADAPKQPGLPSPPPGDVRKIVYYADASAVRGEQDKVQRAVTMLSPLLTTPSAPLALNDDVDLIGYRLQGRKLQMVVRARNKPAKPLVFKIFTVDAGGKRRGQGTVKFSGAPQTLTEKWRPGHLYLHEQQLTVSSGKHELWVQLGPNAPVQLPGRGALLGSPDPQAPSPAVRVDRRGRRLDLTRLGRGRSPFPELAELAATGAKAADPAPAAESPVAGAAKAAAADPDAEKTAAAAAAGVLVGELQVP